MRLRFDIVAVRTVSEPYARSLESHGHAIGAVGDKFRVYRWRDNQKPLQAIGWLLRLWMFGYEAHIYRVR